jgi:hypothetical protein
MKRVALGAVLSVLAVTGVLAAQQSRTFTGEITDAACAAMGGHAAMLSKGETPAHCVLECVKSGSKFVLFDGSKQTVYQLDDQKKPAAFAADKVTVTGTLSADGKTIHVVSIAAAK